ncbi:MAG: hypothetical protein COB37_10850 [Kordiimonadales bacterium]|nr:MAG: hypothetical protein COB37_10850 [Kordiimonadales bacterium]
MDFKVMTEGNAVKIELDGELTFDTHRDFREIMNVIRDAQSDIEVNLGKLKNIDSAGAGMLKLAQEKAKESGNSLSLTEVPKDLKTFIELLS